MEAAEHVGREEKHCLSCQLTDMRYSNVRAGNESSPLILGTRIPHTLHIATPLRVADLRASMSLCLS